MTQISDLDDSPSLLDILTTQLTIPSHGKRQDANQRLEDVIQSRYKEGGSSENYPGLKQQREKAGCVRRLQLSYLITKGGEDRDTTLPSSRDKGLHHWSEDASLPKRVEGTDLCEDSKFASSVVPFTTEQDSSLLVLEPQATSPLPTSPPTHSDSPDELFTTALEPPTTPISPPYSSSVPFLAESLKKIELRRQALRASQQQQPLTPSNTASSTRNPLTNNTVGPIPQSKRIAGGPFDKSHQMYPCPDSRNGISSNPGEMPPEEEKIVDEPLMKADYTNSSLLANCSFAADITTQIPRHLHTLTDQELRQRLVARGEQPGPITELTRPAYLVYLSKLEAGIQPAGNTGYKGQHVSYH